MHEILRMMQYYCSRMFINSKTLTGNDELEKDDSSKYETAKASTSKLY